MVKLNETSTGRRLHEYSKFCLYGGLKYYKWNRQSIIDIVTHFDKNHGLFICGMVGSGKTLILSMLQKITHPQAVNYFTKAQVLAVTKDFNTKGPEVFNRWDQKNMLFDDLGTEKMGIHFGNKCEVMAEFIQYRYELFHEKKLITHFTTNLSTIQVEQRYGARAYSRLKEMNEIILLGTDQTYKDQRPLKNFYALPDVYHPPILTPEEIAWDARIKAIKEENKDKPQPVIKPMGLGGRTKAFFEIHQEAVNLINSGNAERNPEVKIQSQE